MSMPDRVYYKSDSVYPVKVHQTYVHPSYVLTTGMFGMVVGSTTAMGVNLHRVQKEEMTLNEAFIDSLAKGAGAGVATAAAAATAGVVGSRGLVNLAVILSTATGVGYLLNSVGESVACKQAVKTGNGSDNEKGDN